MMPTIKVFAISLPADTINDDVLDPLLKLRLNTSGNFSGAVTKAFSDALVSEGNGILLLRGDWAVAAGVVIRRELATPFCQWLQVPLNEESWIKSPPKYEAKELTVAETTRLIGVLEKLQYQANVDAVITAPVDVPSTALMDAPASVADKLPALPPTLPGTATPRNIILHGPPGTGKTFTTARRALELLRVIDAGLMTDAARAVHFNAFQQHGRVAFVTFHQSYGYEDFVEGLRPKLNDVGEVSYELHKGIFAQMAERAYEAWRDDFDARWASVIESLKQPRKVQSYEKVEYTCSIGDSDNLRFKPTLKGDTFSAPRAAMKRLWNARGSIVAEPKPVDLGNLDQKTHSTPMWMAWQELVAARPNVPQFVLVIDEINRGNISKILGELITLIEADKRLGMDNELQLRLAFSPEKPFGVPPNLHILGTMNTADRSIALLDVALRRRFDFEEMMPRPDIIPEVLEKKGVADKNFQQLVRRMVEAVNKRIRFLLDREHQIGHAYFLNVRTNADLRDVLVNRVIPLLQEYFHGAWDRVCIVLGCPYERPDGVGKPRPARKGYPIGTPYSAPMMKAVLLGEMESIGFDHDDLEDRVAYEIADEFLRADEAGLKKYFDELVA